MEATQIILLVLNGLLFGLTIGILVFVNRMDKRAKDDAERMYQALPPVWQAAILRFLEAANVLVKIAEEVTDGKPNEETTPEV